MIIVRGAGSLQITIPCPWLAFDRIPTYIRFLLGLTDGSNKQGCALEPVPMKLTYSLLGYLYAYYYWVILAFWGSKGIRMLHMVLGTGTITTWDCMLVRPYLIKIVPKCVVIGMRFIDP
ncbi:hypothetical protein ASPBRDRAFT_270652 [Aspergillus brasiliensis CBS 101740]|uniref:Uncharacterized protein n=1 Tax=Aspergillus brasiliensis (strain CBS 101740 / IMI 381727 / IBT 21946) TaxID=767769 RepID=A0A1L9UC65_ASPBC|nr:hypothetical protein ASPBRDRAFT_270652 [Aspergillus brasiliensis CBS 101740]